MNRLSPLALALTLALLPLVGVTHADSPAEDPAEEANESDRSKAPAQLALTGLDPVLLVEGREEEGNPEVSFAHEGFEYRFTRAEHRETFAASPDRYAIQLEGACAAMPGSSGADPSLFKVYEGKIYIFGSTTCREHFSETPERFLAAADSAG